jgi:hypothetical protein
VIYGVGDDQTLQQTTTATIIMRNNNGSIRSSNHSQDGWLPDNNQFEIEDRKPSVIEILLQANQGGVSRSARSVGRRPLHWAWRRVKWDQGVKPW